MTPNPRLRLVCHPPSRPEHTPLHADTNRTQLWELVRDNDVHWILKVPGLMELARRHDSDLLDYCEELLQSDNHEEWLLGLKALAELATPESIERLVMIYAGAPTDNRREIIKLVARNLTTEHVHPFSIMVREIAHPGEVDVTGWTSAAVATLQNVCKRLGIEVTLEGISLSASDRILALESDLIETNSTLTK